MAAFPWQTEARKGVVMRVLTIVVLLAALPVGVWGQGPWPGAYECARAKQAACWFEAGSESSPGLRDERAADTDVLHYNLDVEINPTVRSISGSNLMTVRSLVDGLDLFRFRLHQALAINELRVDDAPASWTRLDSATVEVTLNRTYAAGEEFYLGVAYAGVPLQGNGYVYISSSRAFTISEPWFAYLWWPCKDDLLDKTTAELAFTFPSSFTVASNGVLRGVDDVGAGRRRYRWETQFLTADYLYCFGAAPYSTFGATWSYGGRNMPLEFFIFPSSDSPANRAAWLKTADMLTTYSDLYGLYPFVTEKYGIYQFSNVWFGGMEHQTMTGQMGFSESNTAHELSHQWWGDDVTCATWHDIWLNEGFATYSEALWYEHKPGSSGEPALHGAMANLRPTDVNDTVYCYDISSPARIFSYNFSYLKAAWVLHMLRHIVGDDAFFDILATYRAAYQGGAATTADFQQVAESVTGRDLSWFFTRWLYFGGAPAYRYGWRQYVVDGAGYVELYVKHGGMGSVFTMPIDIQTTDAGGQHTHVVWNDAREEHLLFEVESTNVTDVLLDPKPWILWTGRTAVPFIEGPPKIATLRPAPGAVVAAPDVPTLEIVFQKDVVAEASAFSLVGLRNGPVAFTYSYDAGRHAVTLAPATALASDTYTLTVADSIVDVAGGKALDGELVKPDRPDPLPSGDGLPGGAAAARFAVKLPGDLNCDASIDAHDVNPFVLALTDLTAYGAAYPGCPFQNADCNDDGLVNFADINPFVALLAAP